MSKTKLRVTDEVELHGITLFQGNSWLLSYKFKRKVTFSYKNSNIAQNMKSHWFELCFPPNYLAGKALEGNGIQQLQHIVSFTISQQLLSYNNFSDYFVPIYLMWPTDPPITTGSLCLCWLLLQNALFLLKKEIPFLGRQSCFVVQKLMMTQGFLLIPNDCNFFIQCIRVLHSYQVPGTSFQKSKKFNIREIQMHKNK